jgi:proteasome assembly chaperone (PAC2) family protein
MAVVGVPMIGAGYVLNAEVQHIKEQLGEPGSLPIIEMKIEQLGERAEKIEKIIEEGEKERREILNLMRDGQNKVDSLIDVLRDERREEEQRRGREAQNGKDKVRP